MHNNLLMYRFFWQKNKLCKSINCFKTKNCLHLRYKIYFVEQLTYIYSVLINVFLTTAFIGSLYIYISSIYSLYIGPHKKLLVQRSPISIFSDKEGGFFIFCMSFLFEVVEHVGVWVREWVQGLGTRMEPTLSDITFVGRFSKAQINHHLIA